MTHIITQDVVMRRIKLIVIMICFFVQALSVSATTHVYTVTVTKDALTPLTGSLRWAVQQANANPATDNNIINFAITGSGEHAIPLLSSLYLYRKTTIDGTSQDRHRDYVHEDPLIIIRAANKSASQTTALYINSSLSYGDASGTVIKALEFRDMAYGVQVATLVTSSSTGSPRPTAIHDVTVENCVFFSGDVGSYGAGNNMLLNAGISIFGAHDIAVRGCYFGTAHNLCDTTVAYYGVHVQDDVMGGNPTQKIEIGGAGDKVCVFKNFTIGVRCYDSYSGNSLIPITAHRVHVTHCPFISHFFPTGNANKAILLDKVVGSSTSSTTNDNIQRPVITSIDPVEQSINGTSGAGYQIEVFTNDALETAPRYLGTTMADASGNWSYGSTTPINGRQFFTATATDISLDANSIPMNNTSELAAVTYCKEPVIRAQLDCTNPHVLYIPAHTYTNVQWYKNGTAISGATSTTLNTDGSGLGSGTYKVSVSNGGSTCSYTSDAVVIP